MKLLLADDSHSNRALIKAYAEEAGHEVVTANDGNEAVSLFKRDKPDLVILDVNMPVKDGIEAAREIRQLTDRDNDWIPIVFLSALANSDDIVKGIDAGGDDYLAKPIDAIVLNAKLRAMQRIAEMRQKLQQANRDLELISVRDGLTGLANRRHFDVQIKYELKRAMRSQLPLSVILCDIDHFKLYNDTYGHQKGDDCLKIMAIIMQNLIHRTGDLIARYGGEEFVIILPETRLKNAHHVAELLCLGVESRKIEHEPAPARPFVTVSAGVSTIIPKVGDDIGDVCHDLIKRADSALYKAKDQGRNRVVIAD
jgi:diguanylate cyclase (GGDEF)-like protein